jgi:hypothetical protein
MVASVTDSPSVGTRISAMIQFLSVLSSSAKADDPVIAKAAVDYWMPMPVEGMTNFIIPARLPEAV